LIDDFKLEKANLQWVNPTSGYKFIYLLHCRVNIIKEKPLYWPKNADVKKYLKFFNFVINIYPARNAVRYEYDGL